MLVLTVVAAALLPQAPATAAGSWSSVSCRPACGEADLLAVDFIGDETGWAAGTDGVIVRTDNAGNSWRRQSVPIEADITTLRFRDRFTGFAGGRFRGVLVTTDGGRNWTHDTAVGAPVSDFSVGGEFTFALGGRTLFRTDDATTWSRVSELEASALDFADDQNGWAAGEEVLTTDDGGRTWTEIETGVSAGWSAVDFTSPTDGWLAGSAGLYATTDAGDTWTDLDCAEACADLRDAAHSPSGVGVVAGDRGLVAETEDGGDTWASPGLGASIRGASIAALDLVGDRAWAVTERGTMLTREINIPTTTTPWRPVGIVLIAVALALLLGLLMSLRSAVRVRAPVAMAGLAVVAGGLGVLALTARACPAQGCETGVLLSADGGGESVATTSTTRERNGGDPTTTTNAAGGEGTTETTGSSGTTSPSTLDQNGNPSPVDTTTTSTTIGRGAVTTTTTTAPATHQPLAVFPTFVDQNCYGPDGVEGTNDDNLPPFVVTLDNTKGTEIVSFSIAINGQTWDQRPWATVDPGRGAIEPGKTLDVLVTPDQESCWFANARSGEYFLDITRSDGPLVTVTDRVTGYMIPG